MTPLDVVKTRLQLRSHHEPARPLPPGTHPLCCQAATAATTTTFSAARDAAGAEWAGCVYASPRPAAAAAAAQRHARPPAVYPVAAAHHAYPAPAPRALPPLHRKLASTCALAHAPVGRADGSQLLHPSRALAVDGLDWAQLRQRWLPAGLRRPAQAGMLDCFLQIGRREGIPGLWRGLSPTVLMTVPSQVTYMVCYDFFKGHVTSAYRSLSLAPPPAAAAAAPPASVLTPEQLLASLLSGALARSISATLVTPLELLRTRLQAVQGGLHQSMGAHVQHLVQEARAKPASLWRGLGPTLYRDVPFSAIYFAAYETFKRALTGGSGLGERHVSSQGSHHSHSSEFAVAFASGASAGILAALVTHPFDLIKTRSQALTTSATTAAAASATDPTSATSARQPRAATISTGGLLRSVYRAEGLPGLFRGLSPRIVKVGPSCGLMIGSFEVVGRLLDA